MLNDVKELLISEPQHIVNLLEEYGFYKIKIHNSEIRCAYSEDGNGTSISIRLQNNPSIYVTDFARGLSCDLIDYFIKTRSVSFKSVINSIKRELGIAYIDGFHKKEGLFGGVFDSVVSFGPSSDEQSTVYPESILNEYEMTPSKLFVDDGISIKTQRKYQIGFDHVSQRITIPIRSGTGDLIGVKGRCNYSPREGEPKYLYLTESCQMSKTLFGFFENYEKLLNDFVIILESEKSVMQLDTMGCYHGVAIGSNSLSVQQARLISSLNPTQIIIALDNSLPLLNTAKNIITLRENCSAMKDFKIKFFDWTNCNILPEKASPTDLGKETFQYIINNYIKDESYLSGLIDKIKDGSYADIATDAQKRAANDFFGVATAALAV